jgi:hypothetical protein
MRAASDDGRPARPRILAQVWGRADLALVTSKSAKLLKVVTSGMNISMIPPVPLPKRACKQPGCTRSLAAPNLELDGVIQPLTAQAEEQEEVLRIETPQINSETQILK